MTALERYELFQRYNNVYQFEFNNTDDNSNPSQVFNSIDLVKVYDLRDRLVLEVLKEFRETFDVTMDQYIVI